MALSRLFKLIALLLLCPHITSGRSAEPRPGGLAIYCFVGRYTTGSMGDSANPFRADYEHSYLLAVAGSYDLMNLGAALVAGVESGLAVRRRERLSGELWTGLKVRYRGLAVFDRVLFKPALTAGLSMVDRSIGAERRRELGHGGNARLLFYLGPEVAWSFVRRPEIEVVYRLHHRSGANRTLGNLMEGHNANTVGIRRRF